MRRKILVALTATTLMAVSLTGCKKSASVDNITTEVQTVTTETESEIKSETTTVAVNNETTTAKPQKETVAVKETKASVTEETSGEGKLDKETESVKEEPTTKASAEATTKASEEPSTKAQATTQSETTAKATQPQTTTAAPKPTEAPTPAPTVHVHSYTNSITKNPTCTENGVMTFSCSCGDSYTEAIGATGHNYERSVVTESTCFTEGLYVIGCTKCGDYYNETMPMKSHVFSDYEYQYDATYESDGTEVAHCSGNQFCTATDTRVAAGTKLETPPLPSWNGPEIGVVHNNGDGTYSIYVCPGVNNSVAAANKFSLDGHGGIGDCDMGEFREGHVVRLDFN